MHETMTSYRTNLEETRGHFGSLQSEIDELRMENAALKDLDLEDLQNEVEELQMQNHELVEAQEELEAKLELMETQYASYG